MAEGQAVSQGRWEHFPHDADMGVRGYGPTKAAAFEQAALALTAVITEPSLVESQQRVMIEFDVVDDTLALADWLNALIYEMATRRLLFSAFHVTVDDGRLVATAWGEPVNVNRHQPAVEVKGATFTDLVLRQEPSGEWMAQCIVDV
jgi:SHS2 domain-containing protein